jgi:hypothetical protein
MLSAGDNQGQEKSWVMGPRSGSYSRQDVKVINLECSAQGRRERMLTESRRKAFQTNNYFEDGHLFMSTSAGQVFILTCPSYDSVMEFCLLSSDESHGHVRVSRHCGGVVGTWHDEGA